VTDFKFPCMCGKPREVNLSLHTMEAYLSHMPIKLTPISSEFCFI